MPLDLTPDSHNCGNCRWFVSNDGETGNCNLDPVPVPKGALDFCSHFQAHKGARFPFGQPPKFTDRQLWDYIATRQEVDPNCDDAYQPTLAQIMDKFNVSKRTAEERLKKCVRKGLLQIVDWRADGGPKFVRCFFDETTMTRKPYPDDDSNLPEASLKSLSKRKWDWPAIHGVFAPLEHGTALQYNVIAAQAPKMGRATFNRIMKEAVATKKLTRRADGLYCLPIPEGAKAAETFSE